MDFSVCPTEDNLSLKAATRLPMLHPPTIHQRQAVSASHDMNPHVTFIMVWGLDINALLPTLFPSSLRYTNKFQAES